MTFTQQLIVTLLDKLVIGIIVLAAGYFINRALKEFEGQQAIRKEIEIEQNKAALAQLEAQIKELYSPLYGLIQQSREVYEVAKSRLPSITSGEHNDEEAVIWRYFTDKYILPLNAQMAGIIRSKIHLVEEDELPESWRVFLEHQTQLDILHKLWTEKNLASDHVTGRGWPPAFELDVKNSLNRLRREYNRYARRLKVPPASLAVDAGA